MIWLIGVGGAIGAASRYLIGISVPKKGNPLPFPTLVINIVGSFILGLLVNLHNSGIIEDSVYYFFGIGFCGAFTTFSTFSYEVVMLMFEKRVFLALEYILGSFILALIGAFMGLMV